MRLRIAAVCAPLIGLLVFVSMTAATGPNHPLLQRIPGVLYPGLLRPEPFKGACGVAVDAQERIYVASYYQNKIEVLGRDGVRLAAILKEEPSAVDANPISGPCDLALDSAGNLYVNNWHRSVVKFPPLPTGTVVNGPGTLIDANHPTSVAVDPLTDHVYVVARTYVAEYEPPVVAGEEPLRKIGLGTLGDGYGVAISGFAGAPGIAATAGFVYVADAADDTIKVYDPQVDASIPVRTIDGAGTPRGSFYLRDADLAIDPGDGHLYVTDNLQPDFEHPELSVHEFSAAGLYRGRLPYAATEPSPTHAVDAIPSAVAVAGDEIFVTSGNFDNAELLLFGPAPPLATRILRVTKSGAGSGTVARVPSGWVRCGTACEAELDFESSLQLVATPDPHNRFAGWSGCPQSPKGSSCTVRMDTDVTLEARFEPVPPQPLSVSWSGAGAGRVVSAPAGVDCRGDCGAEFDEGSTVVLTATPDAGSRFAGWSGCDDRPTPSSCAVTMSAARSLDAEFEPLPPPPPPPPAPGPVPRSLTVALAGIGGASGTVVSNPAGIDCGLLCTRLYAQGAVVTLVARPLSGSIFAGWGGCDEPAGSRCAVRLGTDRTLVAVFAPGRPGPLRLRRLAVRGAAAVLELAVPAAGSLTVNGRGLRPASALPLSAGRVTLRLRLSRAGRLALKRARRHRLGVELTISLTPFEGGEEVVATKTVSFGSGRRR